jgi:hypothetical protein
MAGWRGLGSSRWPEVGCGDDSQQVRPIGKDHIGGDGPEVFEEAVCGAASGECFPPGQHGEMCGGVEGEGEQVEGEKDAGQGLLAVAEVVLKVIAVGLQHVEGFVLDLPPAPPAGGQFGDGIGGHRQVGDETVVVGPLGRSVADLDGEPVDRDGIGGAA